MENKEKASRKPKLSLDPINSLFGDTWTLYQERFVQLIRIVLLPTLVTILGYTISDLHLPFTAAIGGVALFVGWLMSIFNILPIIFSIHNKTDVDDSYKAALPWVLPFAWLLILEMLAVMGGLVLFIVPGIWLIFAFSFVSYVFVLERRHGFDALQQSKNYVQGYWWQVVGRVLLMAIFVMMAAAIVQWLVEPTFGVAAASIAGMILSLFTTPFTALFGYNLYNNLKELAPQRAETQPALSGGGFIKASVIVAIVALAVVILVAIFFSWHGVARSL
jgi:hypothetical protein